MKKKSVTNFTYAFNGLWLALKDEPNMIFHLLGAILVIFLGWFFQIKISEWLIVILLIGLVISLELTNTAIEEVVDSFTQKEHPGAKKAKDIASAAVLIATIAALIIGFLIFLPYFT